MRRLLIPNVVIIITYILKFNTTIFNYLTLKKNLLKYPFEYFLVFFCLLIFVLETINARLWMNDFKVYYLAAQHLLGDGQVYGQAFGLSTGFFKYSPFAAMFFVPFSFLPFEISKIFLYFLSSGAMIGLFWGLKKLQFFQDSNLKPQAINWLLFVVVVINAPQLFRELHLGNVNMILLFLAIRALLMMPSKPVFSAVLLAICVLFKPHFLLLIPLLVLRKEAKTLLFLLGFIVFGLFLPSFLIGWSANIILLKDWLLSIQAHNNQLISANDNLAFILQNTFFPSQDITVYKLWALAVLLIFALLVLWIVVEHWQKEKSAAKNLVKNHFQIEFCLLLAMIPTLFITDTEHFLLSIPIISYLVIKALSYRMSKPVFSVGLGFTLILYLSSDFISQNSILGIGNALLLLILIGHEMLIKTDTMVE